MPDRPPVLAFAALLGSLGLVLSCASIGLPLPGETRPAPSGVVLWSGGVTPTSARVTARLPEALASADSASGPPRLQVHPLGAPQERRLVEGHRTALFPDVIQFALDSLRPATSYRYSLRLPEAEAGSAAAPGSLRMARVPPGRFRTFAEGPQSFRVAVGACAKTGSRHPVFKAIRAASPDLLLHVGDMHYEDIAAPRPAAFREAYHRVHASPEQSALFRAVPLAYMWDDHDYGPNNSSRAAPGQNAAQRTYRTYVPHYPLPDARPTAPVYQAFTLGRVRFLLTDLRSARTPNDARDAQPRTMMGAAQKAWFKAELAAARDRHPLVVWVSSVPWIANDPGALDRWSGFPEERRELATYIDSIGMADRVAVVSGDAHMVALDDGANNHYGTPEGGGFPVVHAAALDRRGSVKGGPYTHGPFPNRATLLGANDGQFVLMDVTDQGGASLCVTWTGKRYRYDHHDVVDLLEWSTCFEAPPASTAPSSG